MAEYNSSYTGAEVDAAVAREHVQNSDTALGAQSEDLDMNTHQVVSLSVPDAAGEAIRQTVKITEVALESTVDSTHTQNSDTKLDDGEINEVTSTDLRTHLDSVADPHDMQDNQVEIYGRSDTVRDGFDAALRNGFVSGCTVNDLGGLNISVDAGVSFVDGSLFTVNALESTGLTDNATNWIYSLKDNTTVQIATSEPAGEFALREICTTYSADIHHCFDFPLMSGGLRGKLWGFLNEVLPAAVRSGCAISIDTDATNVNDFKVGTGSYFLNALDETTIGSTIYSAGSGHGDSNVEAHFHTNDVWGVAFENGVNFAEWDSPIGDGETPDLQGKANVVTNKWYCGFIFMHDDIPIYVYPQTEHSLEVSAQGEEIVYPPYHEGIVLPVARFIFRGSAVAFASNAYFEDIRPFFGTGGGTASVQNIYQTVTGDSGSTSATASDDSLEFEGGTGIVTAVTADKVSIALAAEYEEITNWLDDVTLGSNGLTSVPEVVLVPRAAALSDTEGGMYYSNVDKSVYVCTSAV